VSNKINDEFTDLRGVDGSPYLSNESISCVKNEMEYAKFVPNLRSMVFGAESHKVVLAIATRERNRKRLRNKRRNKASKYYQAANIAILSG